MVYSNTEKYASSHFRIIKLGKYFNRNITKLNIDDVSERFIKSHMKFPIGEKVISRGIPFEGGTIEEDNVIIVKEKTTLNIDEYEPAKGFVFMHTMDFLLDDKQAESAYEPFRGESQMANHVGDYTLVFDDGTEHLVELKSRINICEPIGYMGIFGSVPSYKPFSARTMNEDVQRGRFPKYFKDAGTSATRVRSVNFGTSYLCYVDNPYKNKVLKKIIIKPSENSTILLFAVSASLIDENPLYWVSRRRVLVELQEGETTNEFGEYDFVDIDLGAITNIFNCKDYKDEKWDQSYYDVPPSIINNRIIIEYTGNKYANLYLGKAGNAVLPISSLENIEDTINVGGYSVEGLLEIDQSVKISIIEKKSGRKVAAKFHCHLPTGEYLAPLDRNRIPTISWLEDYSLDNVHKDHYACYVNGEAFYKMPLGRIYIEVTKGFAIKPIRTHVEITKSTKEIKILLEKVINWREKGWVCADTHVHFLSPLSALFEGEAEDVNVVNLLAAQWGELFTNVGDFDGRTTIGEKSDTYDGEYLVRVGTENRQVNLGHISLLGYKGNIILPLSTDGPTEGQLGSPVECSLVDWAQKCKEQDGIVIIPHFTEPRGDSATAIIEGLVDGIEMTSWGNRDLGISPFGISDWYRYLNSGYQVPIVGGTDKMDAQTAVGTVRTFVKVPLDVEFDYDLWKNCMKKGETFVSYGPYLEFAVNDVGMGGKINLPRDGGTVDIDYKVSSVTIPVTKIELVSNGMMIEERTVDSSLKDYSGTFSIRTMQSCWFALRIRGAKPGLPEIITAHSSSVFVIVGNNEIFSYADALTILEQIEGVTTYIMSIGTKSEDDNYKRILLQLNNAHRALHNRFHANGIYHDHILLNHKHSPEEVKRLHRKRLELSNHNDI